MKDLLSFIFQAIGQNERARIDEADANPNKWYELFFTHEDGFTESVESADTFAGIIKNIEKYVLEYRFDRINIDIWENNDFPVNTYAFFSPSLIYPLIHDYLQQQNALESMRFVGEILFPEAGSEPKYQKDYSGNGDIFISEIAFRYFHDLTCYVPHNAERNGEGYSYADFLEIVGGSEEIAKKLFDMVTWEHPSTLFDQWLAEGILEE